MGWVDVVMMGFAKGYDLMVIWFLFLGGMGRWEGWMVACLSCTWGSWHSGRKLGKHLVMRFCFFIYIFSSLLLCSFFFFFLLAHLWDVEVFFGGAERLLCGLKWQEYAAKGTLVIQLHIPGGIEWDFEVIAGDLWDLINQSINRTSHVIKTNIGSHSGSIPINTYHGPNQPNLKSLSTWRLAYLYNLWPINIGGLRDSRFIRCFIQLLNNIASLS